jgi:hypothetical protein
MKDRMGGTRSKDGQQEELIVGRSENRWENNIKMDSKETGYESMA